MSSPKREFAEYLEALRARLEREHRPPTRSEWRGLRDRHVAWTRWALDDTPNTPGHVQVRTQPTSWELIEVELGPEPPLELASEPDEATIAAPSDRSPSHRPREALSIEKVRRLEEELAKRRAAGDPRRGALTQAAIAARVGLERHRVQQAIALQDVGWNLLESHPDFSANDGVRWPYPKEVPQIRGF